MCGVGWLISQQPADYQERTRDWSLDWPTNNKIREHDIILLLNPNIND
jgi:hypothetical protein